MTDELDEAVAAGILVAADAETLRRIWRETEERWEKMMPVEEVKD